MHPAPQWLATLLASLVCAPLQQQLRANLSQNRTLYARWTRETTGLATGLRSGETAVGKLLERQSTLSHRFQIL